MPDYNLTHLTPHTFEALIQALAVKYFGPKTIIFGAGPDGGREATFKGKVSYPTPENSWDGYGVIQAKFLSRSTNTTQGGQWAENQLRQELTKFVTRDLPPPEYYIFATNAMLSAVADTGAKDKVYAVFEEFKSQLPLKGCDVWDYDKAYLSG